MYGIIIKLGINNINKKLQLSKYFVTSYLVTLSPNNVFLTYFNLYLRNDLRYYDETMKRQLLITSPKSLSLLYNRLIWYGHVH